MACEGGLHHGVVHDTRCAPGVRLWRHAADCKQALPRGTALRLELLMRAT